MNTCCFKPCLSSFRRTSEIASVVHIVVSKLIISLPLTSLALNTSYFTPWSNDKHEKATQKNTINIKQQVFENWCQNLLISVTMSGLNPALNSCQFNSCVVKVKPMQHNMCLTRVHLSLQSLTSRQTRTERTWPSTKQQIFNCPIYLLSGLLLIIMGLKLSPTWETFWDTSEK